MIFFKQIEMSNFMSVGNAPITIDYTKSKKTLVSAHNGAGKSSILLDSISFVLYGKPYRSITKGQLVNSVNGKKTLVTVWFDIGTDKYRVIRGIKPNVFEIYKNDLLINEDANSKDYQNHLENNILKMNYRTFTQVVVLSQDHYVPFMKLPAAHRRSFIEDILDIGIFSVMNIIIKDKLKENDATDKQLRNDLDGLRERARMQAEFIRTLEIDRAERVRSLEIKITELEAAISGIEVEDAAIKQQIDAMKHVLNDLDDVRSKVAECDRLSAQFNRTMSKCDNDIADISDMITCPTCKQDVHEEHKHSVIESIKEKSSQVKAGADKLSEKFDKHKQNLVELLQRQKELIALQNKASSCQMMMNANRKMISDYQRDMRNLETKVGTVDEEKAKLAQFGAVAIEKNDTRKKNITEKAFNEAIATMLKDSGIKTRIIKQYIPVFNKLINQHLNDMGLFVNFTLDENFNEIIKSRHRDLFTYGSFSAGEQQRIDLSMLFVFREIARLKSAVSTNLLILDEVLDSHLEEKGVDAFFAMIGKMPNTNVFVISHRDVSDRFDVTLNLVKRNNFTCIE